MRIEELKKRRVPVICKRPALLVTILCSSIFVAELAVSAILSRYAIDPAPLRALVDGAVLVVLLAPLIYRLIIVPMRRNNLSLWTMANTDPLTCAYNRMYLMDVLNREFSRAKRMDHVFSLLMIDIDRFKTINDTYGHPAGDKVLVEVSELFASEARDYDTVSRYGGEEFVILLPATAEDDAFTIAERLRLKAQSITFAERGLQVTISIGVVTYDNDTYGSVEEMLHAVDQYLYQAKRGGRNQTVVSHGEDD